MNSPKESTDHTRAPVQADTIFFGGDIITVDDANPEAEALAIKGEKIVAVGGRDSVFQSKGPDTRLVDLGGKTLMPGLIEPHTHPVVSALLYDWIDVSGFNNHGGAEVMEKLRKAAVAAKPGEWITAFGYDPILTRDLKALNINTLDGISSTNPIFVMIQSMHTVFVNQKAFERAGITHETPQPQGGVFVKDKAGNLTGMVIEQSALFPFMMAIMLDSTRSGYDLLKRQIRRYGSAGYTTVGVMGDFPMFPNAMKTMKELVENDDSSVRMVSMDKSTDLETGQAVDLGPSTDRFKTVGVKFWYDGSPYTGNMFLDAPFLNSDLMQSGLGLPRDNRGSTILPKEALGGLMRKYHDQGFQIAVHAQGDRAIRDVIDLFEAVLHESPREDHRHRIEHCALFPIDQLGRAAKLGLTPSWHINHIYYYGEALRDEILGPDRARIFMPMAAARKQGLINSLHNDSPMYPAEPFKLMRTAVTRETRNGAVIAADQAITVKEAIEAVTINAARQLFMENKVGSLEKGKLADLVVLSQNPFRVDPRKLHEICVVESYRGGNKAMIQLRWVR